jgi:putative colanic acid biosysnthesis UDP-glucose lipid carrier transferase
VNSTRQKLERNKTFKTGSDTWVDFLSSILDPAIAITVYSVLSLMHHSSLLPQDIIVLIVTFSLMYPSKTSFRRYSAHWIRDVVFSWFLTISVIITLGVGTGSLHLFDTTALLEWAVITPVILILAHFISPRVLNRVLILRQKIRTIVVGITPLASQLNANLKLENFDGIDVIGYFDDRKPERLSSELSSMRRGNLEDIHEFVSSHSVERIMITLPMANSPRVLKLLEALRDTTASVYFVPDFFMKDLIQARMDRIAGLPVLAVCESPFHGIDGSIKRLSDILVSIFAIVILSPIFLLTAIAIKLSSKGPIIFKQRRYGLDGKDIEVWKFRSMKVLENGANVIQAKRDDDRVTAVGRFIRKTSIDELPQFFNVLQGRMSVVGPRPHAVAHNEMYRTLVKGYMVRHKVRPGITGLAQVSGARGETTEVSDMEKRIEFDLQYLRDWSLHLDFRIMVRTLKVFFYDPKAF